MRTLIARSRNSHRGVKSRLNADTDCTEQEVPRGSHRKSMRRTCSLQCADKRVSRRGDPARAGRGITRVAPAFWRCAASCASGACGSLYKRSVRSVRLTLQKERPCDGSGTPRGCRFRTRGTRCKSQFPTVNAPCEGFRQTGRTTGERVERQTRCTKEKAHPRLAKGLNFWFSTRRHTIELEE